LAASPQFPFWLGYIINMSGYDFRKGQLVTERNASVCKRRDGLYLKDKGVRTLGRRQDCPAERVL